jgi:hypothetical protein
VTGSVKPREIVETFSVPMVTVKRYMKVYRQQGAKGFYESKPRHSSASKLKGELLERAQQLLDQGRSVAEVGRRIKRVGQHDSQSDPGRTSASAAVSKKSKSARVELRNKTERSPDR